MNSGDVNFNQTCICGRKFTQHSAYNYHWRGCKNGKKRLSGALAKAKEAWIDRKRRRIEVPGQVEARMPEMEEGSLDAQDHTDQLDFPMNELSGPEANSAVLQPVLHPVDIVDTSLPTDTELNDESSIAQRRPRREGRRLPKRFRDILPEPLPAPHPVSPTAVDPRSNSSPSSSSAIARPRPSPRSSIYSFSSRVGRMFRTPRNVFGLFRQYCSDRPPSHDPEKNIDLLDLSDYSTNETDSSDPQNNEDGFYPFPNENSFLLGEWYWNRGVQKSRESFSELLGIVGNPDFRPEDVRHAKWNKIDAVLAKNDFDENGISNDSRIGNGNDVVEGGDTEWIDEDAGWRKTPISISVPFHSRMKYPGPEEYVVGDLYHRSFVSVIREKLASPHDDQNFHYEPFELFWKPTEEGAETRVHGELYTSPAFVEAHRDLQNSHREPGCDLPKVVVAMMFWSDGTNLTSFGQKKLWPAYLFFGNETKYHRCKPTCHLCNHVAYFESLPDAFKDFATRSTGGKTPSKAFMTHCRREVMHAQWKILLDDEFLEAYSHGIIIECCDGIKRRFYPRIFTYSADYPEKVLLASIRDKGRCPCPRCLIPLSRVQNMGMPQDMNERETLARVDDEERRRKVDIARDIVYEKNFAVDNVNVEALLKEQSLVPTSNAFSEKLAPLGFNLFLMFVVDLMHEFELGVWRALFIHLLRILQAADKALIHELDSRFRQMPTFGADTIRRFSNNVSELKKFAARDFEDLLQCSMPVFEGLLPEPHNSAIQRLLFTCAHWHGLAKLRMHTDQTLETLDDVTVQIGAEFRAFSKKTCSAFDTRELYRETQARKRRRLKKAKSNTESADLTAHSTETPDGPLPRKFNLQVYKYHSLGDYANTIRRLGTSDSFSTEPGELEHRRPKARFKRTDKKREFVRQMARIERREFRLRRIRARLSGKSKMPCEAVGSAPHEHHHIGVSQNNFEHIGTFLQNHAGDPATKDFLPKLKQHLLPRVLSKLQAQGEHSTDIRLFLNDIDACTILFQKDRIYRHNIMRTNYTTYDIRRSQDVVNASTSHCNVMVLADSSDDVDFASAHPFRYARVLGIYHANVVYVGPGMLNYQPSQLEFLWVRWYRTVHTVRTGWGARKLDQIQFVSMAEDDAFGFLDPSDVLRGCHVVPAFVKGRHHADGIGLSHCAQDSADWAAYYVNRFVDRDMMMRYKIGQGVGHAYAHGCSSFGVSAQGGEGSHGAGDENDEEHGIAPSDSGSASEDSSDSHDDRDDMDNWEEDREDEEFLAMYEMYGFS